MFCTQCGTAVPDTARYCHQCGFAMHNTRPVTCTTETPAKVDEPAAALRSMRRKAPAWGLSVAGSIALVLAALILVAFALGTGEGSWPRWLAAFGGATLLCAYAATLFRRDLYLRNRGALLFADPIDQPRSDRDPKPNGQADEALLAFPSEGPPVSR